MPPKRKSDVLEPIDLTVDASDVSSGKENALEASAGAPAVKKARTSDAGEGSSSGTKKGKKANAEPPKNWYEIVLDGEDEVRFPRCRWRIHHLSIHVLMTRLRRERCLFSELNNVFDPLDTKTHLVIAMTATTSAARFVLCRKSRVSRCVTPP